MAASSNGHIEIVKTFIEAGANVNKANEVTLYSVVVPTCTWVLLIIICTITALTNLLIFH